ncbi:phospholipase D family protein [Neisseriaceae bacterium B1]
MKRNACLIVGLSIGLTACQTLPSLENREPSQFIAVASSPALETFLQLPQNNRLPEMLVATVAASDVARDETSLDKSPMQDSPLQTIKHAAHSEPLYPADLYVLADAKDAFAARVALIDKAAVALDVQYYIWRNDVSGSLMLQKLWQAAERGVRVRFLLDDNNTRGLDDVLMALDAHPNIQVRLFNPFVYRKWRWTGYFTDFNRLNRRMHNKSLTADNRVAIVGGRNVGDEYFDVNADTVFADVDVLVSGAIVSRVSQEFDRYWASDSAYPIDRIVKKFNVAQGRAQLLTDRAWEPAYADYQVKLAQSPLSQAVITRRVPYIHAQTQLISDDPVKALDRKVKIDISAAMANALQTPKREMYLVSPYFVPAKVGVRALVGLVQQGVDITVLTNSLRATDVAAVHSGYARYRKPLLKSGVQLYEFKADNNFLTKKDKGLTGSSAASLHAKTFVIDRERVYIGSFNLDPRSAKLNTEMGLVIHQPQLATTMQQDLQQFTQQTAYRVTLDPQNRLQWHNPDTGKTSRKEPEAGFWKRLTSKILSYLPIERLL